MSDKATDDPKKDRAENAVDRASSKTPLNCDEHIDPAEARRSLEQERKDDQATSKSDGGSAPFEAKPNRVREKDDREKEPISDETRFLSGHEQAKDHLRSES